MEARENLYDVIIVGGGPAGLSAAIYMARARYKVLVMEKEKIGGQITITSEIVNYPGVEKTSGTALTQSMKEQAEAFGAEFLMAEVLDLELEQDIKVPIPRQANIGLWALCLPQVRIPESWALRGKRSFRAEVWRTALPVTENFSPGWRCLLLVADLLQWKRAFS